MYFYWFFFSFLFLINFFLFWFDFLFSWLFYLIWVWIYIFNFFFYVIILDWKSLFFISAVMFISSIVILYSIQYIGVSSYSSIRFLYILFLFMLSMVLIIISPNLLSILLGWDGLGLVSYCLVIYYNSIKSYLAGIITCSTNRFRDAGILISLSWTFFW